MTAISVKQSFIHSDSLWRCQSPRLMTLVKVVCDQRCKCVINACSLNKCFRATTSLWVVVGSNVTWHYCIECVESTCSWVFVGCSYIVVIGITILEVVTKYKNVINYFLTTYFVTVVICKLSSDKDLYKPNLIALHHSNLCSSNYTPFSINHWMQKNSLFISHIMQYMQANYAPSAAEHSPCTAPWSGTLCRRTFAHSRTMSPLERAWNLAFF